LQQLHQRLTGFSPVAHPAFLRPGYCQYMSATPPEPAFNFFSHVRRAVGAIGLAAAGAVALVGVLPLVAQPPVEQPAPVQAENSRAAPAQPVLSRTGR
jgi:hypothetical protein